MAAFSQMDQTMFTQPFREEALLVPIPPLPPALSPFFLLHPRDFSITSYLTLSGLVLSLADINLNSPNKGLLSDSMMDVPVDTAVAGQTPAVEGLTEAEEEELRAELMKVLCLGWLSRGTMSRGSLRLMKAEYWLCPGETRSF